MAAAQNTTRAYFTTVIGVEVDAAEAIIEAGIDGLEVLAELDDKDVKTLCDSVRKPGGTIVVGEGDDEEEIPNPGHNIPVVAQSRLKLAAYGAGIFRSIGRPITQVTLSRSRLRALQVHRKIVENHEAPTKLPEVSKSNGIMRALENFPSSLRERHGAGKTALSYIIRESDDPAPLTNQGPNVAHGAEYSGLMDELIECLPLEGAVYAEDNAKVLSLLQEMLKNHPSYLSSLKPYNARRDGRGAYKALLLHNCGSSKWERVVRDAENVVLQREWNGKNARFPLASHIQKHRDANMDMIRASQNIDYAPPNETTRVSRLLASLTSSDGRIVAAKTTILADEEKKSDFELASDFLLTAAPSRPKGSYQDHRISQVSTGKSKRKGKVQVGERTGVEVRYYKGNEYRALSQDQKQELKEIRASSGVTKKQKNRHDVSAAIIERLTAMDQRISALNQQPATPAAPAPAAAPAANPLQPPTGFAQRGGARQN